MHAKTISIDVRGTKQAISDFEIFIRMVRDYNRLGIPPLKAAAQVIKILNYKQ